MNIYHNRSEGEIFYKGIPICKTQRVYRKIYRQMLQMTRQMIFQDSDIQSESENENREILLAEPLRIYSGKGRPGKKEIEKQLELCWTGSQVIWKNIPVNLSGGQRQRVAIARAALHKTGADRWQMNRLHRLMCPFRHRW